MKKKDLPALPPPRRRIPADHHPARRNDVLRRGLIAALRSSGRYSVLTNASVPVPDAARAAVRRAGGGYLAASLPVEGHCDQIVVDLLVIDPNERWAGAYAFCRQGAPSALARSRIEEDLRAAELVLHTHLRQTLSLPVDVVTVGIIDGSADPEHANDLTIAACEIADHFEVAFPDPEDAILSPTGGAPGG
jgi:hypothetical protein